MTKSLIASYLWKGYRILSLVTKMLPYIIFTLSNTTGFQSYSQGLPSFKPKTYLKYWNRSNSKTSCILVLEIFHIINMLNMESKTQRQK